MISFEGAHFERDIILTCVRWYVVDPLSYRQFEELMQERGVSVDHATIHRWVLKYRPQLEAVFHRRRRRVQLSWRTDETSIRVKGQWPSLYRAVERNRPGPHSGRTVLGARGIATTKAGLSPLKNCDRSMMTRFDPRIALR